VFVWRCCGMYVYGPLHGFIVSLCQWLTFPFTLQSGLVEGLHFLRAQFISPEVGVFAVSVFVVVSNKFSVRGFFLYCRFLWKKFCDPYRGGSVVWLSFMYLSCLMGS